MMKKCGLIFLVLPLLIAGCNKPGSSSSISSQTTASSVSSEISTSQSESLSSSESESLFSTFSTTSIYSSSSSELPPEDPWKDLDLSTYGVTFRNKLSSLIEAQVNQSVMKNMTYKKTKSVMEKAAAYPNKDSTTFIPFYHTTDTLAKDSECNKEHVWPNSRGAGDKAGERGKEIEKDPFMIRPAIEKDNSNRGNKFYGDSRREDFSASIEFDPASIGYAGARGEAARIILYGATKYYDQLSLSNNPYDASKLYTMGKLSDLLKWNAEYPVNDMEIQINEYLHTNGYGRNPFVDHPEYADYIWDENGIRTDSPTPKGEYKLINDDLDGKHVSIVSSYDGKKYFGFTSEPVSDTLPWYIKGSSVTISAKSDTMKPSFASELAWFILTKQKDGSYTLYNEFLNDYLYNYIDDNHFSIGYTYKEGISASKYWAFSKDSVGFSIQGTKTPYLSMNSSNNFAGYKSKPSIPFYLYLKA